MSNYKASRKEVLIIASKLPSDVGGEEQKVKALFAFYESLGWGVSIKLNLKSERFFLRCLKAFGYLITGRSAREGFFKISYLNIQAYDLLVVSLCQNLPKKFSYYQKKSKN